MRRRPQGELIIWRRLAGLFLVLVLGATLHSRAPAQERTAPADNEALNGLRGTFDTLRADHLGCYGYTRRTSPAIDALARRAVLYTRALSASPWTLPSHASLFTGKSPLEHGAHTLRRGDRFWANRLDLEEVTLAEALASHGYRTAAIVANDAYLSPFWRLDQGFQTYHVERVYADRLNHRVERWLKKNASRPFFLFVNYIDTHWPYDTRPHRGLLDHKVIEDNHAFIDELMEKVMPGDGPVLADLVRKVVDQYDTAIANLDSEVGSLLARLEKDGRFEDTLIILTSDHGEYFGEHHLLEHSKDIYQPALWIPLIVRSPGPDRPRRDETPIVSNDIAHLIASFMQPDVRRDLFALYPDEPGRHPVITENYFTREKVVTHPVWGHRFQRVRQAIYEWPWKYIRSSDGAHEHYDLGEDPAESNNLVHRRSARARDLALRLRQFLQDHRPVKRRRLFEEMDEEDLRRLRSLGYLDGG